MNRHAPSSNKKLRVWKIVVIISISLNITILGVIGGAALHFGKDGQRGKAKFNAVAGTIYLRALSLEDKRKLGRDMREKQNAQPTTQDNLYALFRMLYGYFAMRRLMSPHSRISRNKMQFPSPASLRHAHCPATRSLL